MGLLLLGLALLAAAGLLAALLTRWPRLASACGAGGCVLAAALGLPPALAALGGAGPAALRHDWPVVPGAALSVHLDALAALFLLPILGVSAPIALAAAPYFLHYAPHKPVGLLWLFFNLLVASMGLTVLAANAVLFLVAWEVMSLAAYFLVTAEDQRPEVVAAGWTYLVSTHLGTAFLVALFAVLGQHAESLDFSDMPGAKGLAAPAGLLFLLALVGFGTKAGVVPFHVWLPEAHPVAPSPVSALLSGVMIKTGIYGLLRVLTFLGAPPPWWAWLLIGLGALGGTLGIANALAQHDLKRLLAYSSIENVGILLLGLGVGLLGLSYHQPAVALLGLAGALLHVLNHSLCKSLLFLAAGALGRLTGTLALDRLGGLLKRQPVLGATFLLGAVAITGLPPLNCFAGEFLIYLGAFHELGRGSTATAAAPLAVLVSLALIGGLAVACFSRAAGAVFLGEPRGPVEAHGRLGPLTLSPLLALAAGCVALGACAPLVVGALGPALAVLSPQLKGAPLDQATSPLAGVVLVSAAFLALLGGLALLRWRLLRGREVSAALTWDCGYAAPTARMQYTASSFAQPLLELFAGPLLLRRRKPRFTAYFPAEGAAVRTETSDLALAGGYRPAYRALTGALAYLRWLQSGRVQLYVLYIVLTLLALLIAYLGA
jgi:formate hydrogenlyase subunit 3/multisubunit Na+/H+ antiporter MnhD subunit